MDPNEKNRLYQKGLEAFNSGQFFEAHELWEDVWRATLGPDKRFLQGLIQIAAGFHHCSRANLVGARKLLQAGLLKLEDVPEVHGGLEIEALRCAVRNWLAATASGSLETAQGTPPPKIACEGGSLTAAWRERPLD